MINMEKMNEVIEKAKEATKNLEEPYKSIAYRFLLEKLWESSEIGKMKGVKNAHKKIKIPSTEIKREGDVGEFDILQISQEIVSNYEFVHNFPKAFDRGLLILKIAKDELDIECLTPSQISEILIKRFEFPRKGNKPNNFNVVFGREEERVSLVDRRGKENTYTITKPGRDHLDKMLEKYGKAE